MTLYQYWRSSCSFRVRWALYHKGIPFRSVPVNLLKGEQRDPKYLRLNPSGGVPTLVNGDLVISESMAILEWLEERFPKKPLLPNNPEKRASIRELCYLITSQIQPLQNLKVLDALSSFQTDRLRWVRKWMEEGFAAFEARLEKTAGTYCMGGEISFADLCLIPQTYNALRFGVVLDPYPLIRKIRTHCLTLESCEKALPENQPGATS